MREKLRQRMKREKKKRCIVSTINELSEVLYPKEKKKDRSVQVASNEARSLEDTLKGFSLSRASFTAHCSELTERTVKTLLALFAAEITPQVIIESRTIERERERTR